MLDWLRRFRKKKDLAQSITRVPPQVYRKLAEEAEAPDHSERLKAPVKRTEQTTRRESSRTTVNWSDTAMGYTYGPTGSGGSSSSCSSSDSGSSSSSSSSCDSGSSGSSCGGGF